MVRYQHWHTLVVFTAYTHMVNTPRIGRLNSNESRLKKEKKESDGMT